MTGSEGRGEGRDEWWHFEGSANRIYLFRCEAGGRGPCMILGVLAGAMEATDLPFTEMRKSEEAALCFSCVPRRNWKHNNKRKTKENIKENHPNPAISTELTFFFFMILSISYSYPCLVYK